MSEGVKIIVGNESGLIRVLRNNLPLEMSYGYDEVVDVVEIKDGFATLKNVASGEQRKVAVALLEVELRYRNVELYNYMTSKFKKYARK